MTFLKTPLSSVLALSCRGIVSCAIFFSIPHREFKYHIENDTSVQRFVQMPRHTTATRHLVTSCINYPQNHKFQLQFSQYCESTSADLHSTAHNLPTWVVLNNTTNLFCYLLRQNYQLQIRD